MPPDQLQPPTKRTQASHSTEWHVGPPPCPAAAAKCVHCSHLGSITASSTEWCRLVGAAGPDPQAAPHPMHAQQLAAQAMLLLLLLLVPQSTRCLPKCDLVRVLGPAVLMRSNASLAAVLMRRPTLKALTV